MRKLQPEFACCVLAALLGTTAATPAFAQSDNIGQNIIEDSETSEIGDSADDAPDIIVSARQNIQLSDLPRAALVLDGDVLRDFNARTTSVQELLGFNIPGLGAPVTEGSAASLTLRGRNPLYLIDGVPIAPNTNFSRFLDKFDPLTLGRTEVIYGPTSLYGAGASGGVIQFFTRDPTQDGIQIEAGTQIKAFAPDTNAFDSDGFSIKTNLAVNGELVDGVRLFAYGSYEDTDGILDANGNLLSGRSNFVNDYTLFAKLDVDVGSTSTLSATINYTELESSDRQFELGALNIDGLQGTQEIANPASYAQPPTNNFLYASLAYRNSDLLGGNFSLLGYYSESEFLNPGSDIRAARQPTGVFPAEWPGLWQTGAVTEEYGLRTEYTRPFGDRLSLTIGGDYNYADSVSLLPISSEDDFDDTGFFDAARQDIQRPPFTLESIGLFVQGSYELTDRLTLNGGVRWDNISYEIIGPYDVVFFFFFPPGERPGGSASADDFSFNGGLVYDVSDEVSLFASYSEGFTLPSLGFLGNNVAPGVAIEDSGVVEPIVATSYDAGIRASFGDFAFQLAAYYSEGNFDTALGVDPVTGLINRGQAPSEVYGFELSTQAQITSAFRLEAAIAYVEGQVDTGNDGNFSNITTQDVPPVKIQIRPIWEVARRTRLFGQLFFTGDRDAAFRDGNDPFPAAAYTQFDLGASTVIDWGDGGEGDLSIQVTNIFNAEQVLPGEATFLAGRRRAGPGRAVTFSYQHRF
ncbi:MAG: TonB-dependent receptor [Pseudomonadota bacterium]